MTGTFRVGVSREGLKPDGSLIIGETLHSMLDPAPRVHWEVLAEKARVLRPDQVRGIDALVSMEGVSAETLEGADRLALVTRVGVGYDGVDVEACTAHGVLITIAPDGVRRPIASAIMCFMLALSHKLFLKDRLTREGRWAEKGDHMGVGLVGRALGSVGFGNIAQEMFRLAAPFEMRHLAYARHPSAEVAAELGVELVSLETLLRESDFLTINCPLTPDTRHLIDAQRLALMKPTAYLINTARGAIVDQEALAEALRSGRLQGAALDVFESEPEDPTDPIFTLDNVIVAPHALGWTNQMFQGCGRSVCNSILEVAAGRVPRNVVNRAVIESPFLQEKLRRYSAQVA